MITSRPKGDVVLTQWNIIEISTTGTQHFVGFDLIEQLGRVSTPIVHFNEERGIAETESGSHYAIIGEPGVLHIDARYVLNTVCPIDVIAYRFRYAIE